MLCRSRWRGGMSFPGVDGVVVGDTGTSRLSVPADPTMGPINDRSGA